MRMSTRRKLTVLLATLALTWLAGDRVSNAARYVVPNPILVLVGQEAFQAGGKRFIRYNYSVFNSADYPADMFAASPNPPPCAHHMEASCILLVRPPLRRQH